MNIKPGCPPALAAYLKSMKALPSGNAYLPLAGENNKPNSKSFPYKVGAFAIGSTPVTIDIWSEYRLDGGPVLQTPDWGWKPGHPVVGVSYTMIMGKSGEAGFCDWVYDVSGQRVTVPTILQYRYAANGGLNRKFPWGNDFDYSKLWCSRKESDARMTAPVKRNYRTYQNRFGLTDMVGNAYCWLRDSPSFNADLHWIFGGSWRNCKPETFRTDGLEEHQVIPGATYGFRICIDGPGPSPEYLDDVIKSLNRDLPRMPGKPSGKQRS